MMRQTFMWVVAAAVSPLHRRLAASHPVHQWQFAGGFHRHTVSPIILPFALGHEAPLSFVSHFVASQMIIGLDMAGPRP